MKKLIFAIHLLAHYETTIIDNKNWVRLSLRLELHFQ